MLMILSFNASLFAIAPERRVFGLRCFRPPLTTRVTHRPSHHFTIVALLQSNVQFANLNSATQIESNQHA